MSDTAALITAVAHLLAAVAWPVVFLFLVIRFRSPIGDFVTHMTEFSFKGLGVEATARRNLEAAVNVGAAEARAAGADHPAVDAAQVAANLARSLPGRSAQRSLSTSTVLWVDDLPDNNRYERQALEALGIHVTTSLTTEDALARLATGRYDLVVSDMGRPPDAHAGYTLLEALRARGDRTPYVIYAGSRAARDRDEARRRGALDSTSSPQELIGLVTRALSTAG